MILENKKGNHVLPDTNQSFWQLSVIQLTGVTSLPVLFASILLAQKNSLLNSVLVLVIANVLLWIIRYSLISMSHSNRKSVIDISRDCFGSIWIFGKNGIYLIAILLLFSTLSLFVEETTILSNALTAFFPLNEGPNIDPFMQISVIIGVVSTIFCIWGIIALRWLSTIAFPIILLALVVILLTLPTEMTFLDHHSLSLSALPLVLGINLSVTADLPTFFRHSQSWKASMFALATIQLISLAIGIGGLFLGAVIHQPFSDFPAAVDMLFSNSLSKIAFISLVVLSSICSNVSNVYSASVGWEVVMPSVLVGKKEYLILGLLLTIIFISITGIVSLESMASITNLSLVNLSFIFFICWLIIFTKKGSLDNAEQSICFLAWFISTLLNILQYSGVILTGTSSLLVGVGTQSVIVGILFLIKSFIKEKKLHH